MSRPKMTSVAVSSELLARLRNMGKMGDSYETVIRRLADEHDANAKQEVKP